MSEIFTPIEIAGLRLKNRVLRSATNTYCGNIDGSVSEAQIRIYETLAEFQIGLIVTENFSIDNYGKVDKFQNSLGEEYSPTSIKELTDRVHRKGASIIVQINHAGGKSKVNENAISSYGTPGDVSTAEIRRLVELFRLASARARECGFDGVQLHCGHGYLLSGFIDPDINHRSDEYGGSASGRFEFPREALEAMKKTCGADYPLLIKINSNTAFDAYSKHYMADLVYFAGECESLGVSAIELSGCDFTGFSSEQHNYYEPILKALRDNTTTALILTGGIRSLENMQQALNSGADIAGLSRPFICEPDFLLRLQGAGGQSRLSRCISCNQCFSLYEKKKKHCILH